MSVEVYYFSGTGNSLAVARDIAQKTNGKLISIPSVINQKSISTAANVIGIIFPVYGSISGRIPSILERFVEKLEGVSAKYIFAVYTYGTMPGVTAKTFSKVVQSCGGKLSAGFAVKMPMNNITIPFYNPTAVDKQQKVFTNWKKKLEFIYEYIIAQKEGKFEATNRLLISLFYPIDKIAGRWLIKRKYNKLTNSHLNIDDLWPLMDVSFHSNAKCDGCGVCQRVCPVNNITMINNAPSWQHHCERCMACLQWCPKEAINFDKDSVGRKRYHHPDVEFSNMLHGHLI